VKPRAPQYQYVSIGMGDAARRVMIPA
jgi:hypothetical protein